MLSVVVPVIILFVVIGIIFKMISGSSTNTVSNDNYVNTDPYLQDQQHIQQVMDDINSNDHHQAWDAGDSTSAATTGGIDGDPSTPI